MPCLTLSNLRRPGVLCAGVVVALALVACGSSSSGKGGAVTTTDAAPTLATTADASTDTAPPASVAATTTPATTTPATTTPATIAPTTTTTPAGWKIEDAIPTGASKQITNYAAQSCDSELGPWHIIVSFSVPDNLTNNVFYDVTVGADGTGPLTGEEHSTWRTGLTVDGTYTGSATLTPADDRTFALALEIDANLAIHDPQVLGRPDSLETSHISKTLTVQPATEGCT